MQKSFLLLGFLILTCSLSDASSRLTRFPSSVRKMTLAPGDTVRIADGTYDSAKIRFAAKGTSGAPVVLMAQTPGGVTFINESQVYMDGEYLVVEGFRFESMRDRSAYISTTDSTSNCRISNCLFDGSACSPNISKSCNFVQLRGFCNEVSGCAFLDKPTLGVSLGVNIHGKTPSRHVIKDNFFYRPTILRRGGSTLNGQECIRVGSSTWSMSDAQCTVTGNWFYHCDGEVETISNKSCGNLYEGNLLEECKGTITLRHGNDCVVRGNFFMGNGKKGSGGVRIIGERHVVENNIMSGLRGKGAFSAVSVVNGYENPEDFEYFQVKDAVVRGNGIYDCDSGLLIGYAPRERNALPPSGLKVENNTIVCNSERQCPVSLSGGTAGSDVSWKKNLIFGGTQLNAEYRQARRRPDCPDVSEQLRDLRAAIGAGTFWKPIIDDLYEHTSNPKLQD